uniref:AIG1-type G domain-containing protein n=1 Tax=Cyprinus carpio carpio TaxID=630221 RepID=A0A9J7ZCJ9_CYPCA
MSEKHLKAEIEKSLQMSAPGAHVFLLVIRLGRFTEEEKNTVKWIQENFGEDVKRFTIVLFNVADKLNKPLVELLQENPELDESEGRYHAFNNVEKKDGMQISYLLEKIKRLVEKNKGEYYTSEMFNKNKHRKQLTMLIMMMMMFMIIFLIFFKNPTIIEANMTVINHLYK